MKKEVVHKVTELTALFPPDTAGQGMVVDVPVFSSHATVAEAYDHVIHNSDQYNTINYLYVINSEGQLRGVVSIKELVQAKKDAPLSGVMRKKPITANPMDTVQKVALIALSNNLKMIPIVDHKHRLLGAYSSDQLLDILNREFSNDLLRMSGVTLPRKHFAFDSLRVFWARFPWMVVGMLGGLATGSIIGAFRSSIEAIVLLAVFIPVIASTGATSANQSAMIFIRNLIHGDIKNRLKYIVNELKIASMLGGTLGLILFFILWRFLGDYIFAFAVSFSLALTIIAGAMIGVFTPWILTRFKFDPSIGAGPFLTIIKDLVAMTIYFSVVTGLLQYFV